MARFLMVSRRHWDGMGHFLRPSTRSSHFPRSSHFTRATLLQEGEEMEGVQEGQEGQEGGAEEPDWSAAASLLNWI